MEQKRNIGIIILAAGASTRLGQPKQLLPYYRKPLLQHMMQTAADSLANTVVVVLGAHEDQIKKEVEIHSGLLVINTKWQEGMASSIGCGLNALLEISPQTDAAIIMLCDQPHVTPTLLNELISAYESSGKYIIACQYEHTTGVPALFNKHLFPELMQLKGDTGAKAIIQQHIKDVETVAFSKGIIDIDTAEDYRRFQENEQQE